MTESEDELHSEQLSADKSTDESGKGFATNYALAIALGLPIGMFFGLLVLDDITWGLLIGAGLAPIIAAVTSNLRSED